MSPRSRRGSSAVAPDTEDEVLSIVQLYNRVEGALSVEFPARQPVWVRGEIQTLSDRTGHCYIDLVDPDALPDGDRQARVLKVRCWRQTWGPLRSQLARSGIELTPGTVVHLVGRVEFYRPRAEVNFVMAGLDVTALLGRMAAERAALLATLRAEGLLAQNPSLPVGPVVLRIGLVASPGTEGYRDFLGQLMSSGFGFDVAVSPATVQGAGAPRAIARAISRCGGVDRELVVVVRGGGSKADLVAFDSEPVARAIASCPLPVWTGIGHSGDESVADMVANRSFVTPTECGHELVTRLVDWWQSSVVRQSALLAHHAQRALDVEERNLSSCRGRVAGTARHQLRWHRERLDQRVATLRRGAPVMIEAEEDRLCDRVTRLAPAVRRSVAETEHRLGVWHRLLSAYDVERQLERGYTITTDVDGRVLRTGGRLSSGDVLYTRFVDVITRSVVDEERQDR